MMTYRELRDFLVAAGLPATQWQLPDDTYETVSVDWVTENWVQWLHARPRELVLYRSVAGTRVPDRPLWLADASDCDNLALGTVAHAQVGNALLAQMVKQPRGGLAYGLVFYAAEARPDNFGVVGAHCINWFVDHERNVRFFEPGVGAIVTMRPTERSTAWFGLAA